ncbi:MAG TPA: ABC transporter substrate-binding protein [Burkholderiales bacterium]|nr:ABC transporter substrate-binding protein [Burkholderiales bacterium]
MRRRALLAGLLAFPAAWATGQGAAKVSRIAYISMAPAGADRHWMQALREGLRDHGYLEGRNLVIDERHANNDAAKGDALLRELLASRPAVLVVYGSALMPAIKMVNTDVPVVMTVHADPVGSGVVRSLARPGGNITGLTDGHADLAPKRLDLLRELVPALKKAGVLFNPASTHSARQWKLVEQAGRGLKIEVVPVHIGGPRDAEQAFETVRQQRLEGLVFAPDPTWWVGQEKRIAGLAIARRIPTVGSVREFAEHGILLAYGTNFAHLWRKAATYVDRILKGAKPGDLAIEHPNRFELVVNAKTAKAIGVQVPRAVLARADHVIE